MSFKDNGRGIEPQNLEKIFSLGYTTTNGSGIGLYHVKEIVDSLNGKIHVFNNDVSGITFTIEF